MRQTGLKTTELGRTGMEITRVWQVDAILGAANLELTEQDIAEIEG